MNKFKSRQAKNKTTADISVFTKDKTAVNKATANISFSASRKAQDKATKNF